MSNENKESKKGSNSDDVLAGGSADEKVDGKSGDDIVAGGSGADWVKGGSGDDKLVYVAGLNTEVADFYDGGSGTNTLELQMTRSEWMRDDVQTDIAAYLTFLDSDQPSAQGQNNSKGFEFASLGLTARRLHSLEILVDGVVQDPTDQEVVANDDAHTSAGEHSLVFGNVTDNDDVPDLVREVTLVTAPAQGILTLDADGSFSYDPGDEFDYLAAGESAQVEFSYRVTDADRDSDTAVVVITVTGTNDKPIAKVDSGTTDENVPLLVDVLANDTDVDASDTHTVIAASIASGLGAVAIVGNQVEWTPGTDYDYLALGESATVTIDYNIADNNGAESSSVLTLTVTGSNDGPVANIDAASTDENASLLVDVLANDTDVDASDTHKVTAASIASGLGAVAIVSNQVEWTPGTDYDYLALGESATVTIDYTMADNNGAESSSLLTLTVTGSNDGPVASVDSGSTDENASLLIDVLANDTDVDASDTHTVIAASIASGLGAVAIVGNQVEWTPGTDYDTLALGESATVAINYTMADNNGAESSSLLTLTVTGSNDGPVANVDAAITDENATLLVDVLANDTDIDASDTHTITAASIASGLGAVAIVVNQVEWTPGTDYDHLALGESATVTIDYTMADNNGAESSSVLTLTVTGSNDGPVANVDAASTDENASLLVDVLANDTDVDASDTHTVLAASIASGLGAVAIVANQVEWTPGTDYDYLALGESATVTIDYTIADNNGAESSSLLTLTVTGSNDGPVANIDAASTDENASLLVDVLANDTDVDASDTHTVTAASIASGLGAVAIVSNQIEWTPGADYDTLALGESALVTIDYTQSDNNGSKAGSSLAIEVIGSNDKPVVTTALSSEASEQDSIYTIDLLAGASDVDQGAVLAVANFTEPTGKGGWVLSNNQITIDPDHFDALNNGDVAALNFAYQVMDEHGATVDQVLNLNVNGFTDAPFLEITASAASAVNAIALTVTSQPAGDERVALSFRNIGPDIRVYDAAWNDVTAGVADFSGTEVFTLVMPSSQDTTGNLTIAATGIADDGHVHGESSGIVPLEFDYSNTRDTLIFNSQDQGIWASGEAPMVHFHEYLPLLGGVAQTWNPDTKLWEDTSAAPWTSGVFSAFSSEFSIEDIRAAIKAVPQQALDEAKGTFDGLVKNVDKVWDAAKTAYKNAMKAASEVYDKVTGDAEKAFNNTVAAAGNTTIELAKEAHKLAIETAVEVRDAALTVLGWLGGWVVDGIWGAYNTAVQAADDVLKVALLGVEAVTIEAQKAFDAAKTAANWVKTNSEEAAKSILKTAEEDYKAAKSGVVATAEAVFNEAQKLVNDTAVIVDQMDGKTVLNVDAELFAEVGIKVDFVLDSGSVDTEVRYELDSSIQHNRSTDVLVISPSFTNTTTGQTVAFETVSPNATFQVALLYEVGATFDMFLDSYLISNGETIFDISGDAEGLNVQTTISTGGLQAAIDGAQEVGTSTPGLAVGEVILIDFDSTKLEPFEIPFLSSITDDSLKIEVAVPSVKATGTASNYTDDYYKEGAFINVHPSEIIDSLLNLVTAKLDLSPEMRAKYGIESISDKTFLEALDVVGQALSASIFDILSDGKIDKVPFFVLDARDETSDQLLHGNFVSDDVIGSTVTEDLGTFGFYAGYAESNDIFKLSMDVDQAYSWIINEVVKLIIDVGSSGSATPILDRIPTINPLNLTLSIGEILKVIEAPNEIAKQIDKFLNLEINLETADLDVHSALHFSQDFTLSVDDMSYLLILEDNTQFQFEANQQGNIRIDNASSHDANGDGVVDYNLQIVPTAMFSNDTEFGLSYGYLLDFLQGTLKADLKLPVGDLLPGLPPIVINMLDLEMGPLLRVQGDLDVWSVDIFEDRFDFDIGSQNVAGDFETATPISLIGITTSSEQGLIA